MTDTSLAPTASGRRRGTSARVPSASGTRRTARGTGIPRGTADEWLTVDEVCAELRIGRRTFERWRTLGVAPRATRPTRNGPLKIKRSWLEEWAEDGAT
jgi:hypothetical protein